MNFQYSRFSLSSHSRNQTRNIIIDICRYAPSLTPRPATATTHLDTRSADASSNRPSSSLHPVILSFTLAEHQRSTIARIYIPKTPKIQTLLSATLTLRRSITFPCHIQPRRHQRFRESGIRNKVQRWCTRPRESLIDISKRRNTSTVLD